MFQIIIIILIIKNFETQGIRSEYQEAHEGQAIGDVHGAVATNDNERIKTESLEVGQHLVTHVLLNLLAQALIPLCKLLENGKYYY